MTSRWQRSAARGGLRRPVFTLHHPDLDLDLLVLPTEDGHEWDGLLYVPRRGDPARRRIAVVVVHGSVGNYISGIPRRMSMGLAQDGFSVLSINTRMANYGAFFGGGLLHLTPLDLDAAMNALRRRGYDRVVLLGFSMGSTVVTHYQALRRPPEVIGLCTLAHPASLVNSLRRRWERFGAEPGYLEVLRRARAALGRVPDPNAHGDRGDEIFVVRRAAGPTDDPSHCEIWTHRTWWFSRGPAVEHLMSRNRIEHVGVPVLFVQAGDDLMIDPEEGHMLARFARKGGCPSAEVVMVPGADHVFRGHEAAAVDACSAWLEGLAAA
jgi:pimeloyl-ACP methyl ester carboxylesterase